MLLEHPQEDFLHALEQCKDTTDGDKVLGESEAGWGGRKEVAVRVGGGQ